MRVYDVSADGRTWTNAPVFVLGSATTGSGTNQLNFPYNVDWCPNGRTAYVSDTGNGRIARWDLTDPVRPVWLTPFGAKCGNHPQPCADPPADAGKFNHLRRVAIDPAGNVYGADFWGAGIEVFNPTGASDPVDRGRSSRRRPASAEAYAVDVAAGRPGLRDGPAQPPDPAVHRRRHLRQQGRAPAAPSRPRSPGPRALAVAPNGRRLGRRHPRRPDRAASRPTWPPRPIVQSYGGDRQRLRPVQLPRRTPTSHANGVVWVADTRNDRIQMRFNPTTETFLAPSGHQGTGAGPAQRPRWASRSPPTPSTSPTPATTGSRS